jgi:DNA-binding NarL/FixJ family response regulator
MTVTIVVSLARIRPSLLKSCFPVTILRLRRHSGTKNLQFLFWDRKTRNAAIQIIFVSQESSPDIVQEALSLGTCAYVVKTKAESDLLAAVDAVLEGRQFCQRWIVRLAPH